MTDRTSTPAAARDASGDEWPKVALARRLFVRARAWLCSWLCNGYDRRAGLIIDGLLAEIDRQRGEGQP